MFPIRPCLIIAVTAFVTFLATTSSALALSSQTLHRTGVNGAVNDVEVQGDVAYLAGDFTAAGTPTGYAAVVDPVTALPTDAWPQFNGVVAAAVTDGSGGYFVGGTFTTADGLGRNRIAHVLADGSIDPAWNPNANSTISTLHRVGSTLYVGGTFTSIGGQVRLRIAALDVATGLATSWDPGSNAQVNAIVSHGTDIYVGGTFTTFGGNTRNRIASVDAATGLVTSWNPNASAIVRTLAVVGTSIVAGGTFTSIGGQTRNRIAALDSSTGLATAWDPDADGTVYTLATDGAHVIVGGDFTYIGGAARARLASVHAATGLATSWDPSADNTVSAVALVGSSLYAAGMFDVIGGVPRGKVAKFDAASGALQSFDPRAANGVQVIAGEASGDVFIGGTVRMVGTAERNRLAAIDLVTGEVLPWNPDADGSVNEIEVAGSTAYVGGSFSQVGGTPRSNLAKLDLVIGTPSAWAPEADNSVSALEVSGSTVFVGGRFATIGATAVARLAALDADTGTLVPGWTQLPNPDAWVEVLHASGSTLYVGGSFSTIGGAARGSVAAVDVSTGALSAWDPTTNGTVFALDVVGSTVYTGGTFTTVNGGTARLRIASFDAATGLASNWNPAPDNAVTALAADANSVLVGGTFANVGGQARSRVAELDAASALATSWNPGLDNQVHTIARTYDHVVAGGAFQLSGSTNLGRVAAYRTARTPSAFAFAPVTGADGAVEQTSNDATLSGIDPDTRISVTGGAYSVNGGAFSTAPGTVRSGDVVAVRHTSASTSLTPVTTELSVGTRTEQFASTTRTLDRDPDAFAFTAVSGVPLASVQTSNTVTLTGIDGATPISVLGGVYSVNGGAFTDSAATVGSGDTVAVRHLAAVTNATEVATVLTVGSRSERFASTTLAATPAPPVVVNPPKDTTKPSVTITLPLCPKRLTKAACAKLRSSATAWRTLRGTAVDAGTVTSGVATVQVVALRKVGKRWQAVLGAKLVTRSTKALALATVNRAAVSGTRWTRKLPKLPAGAWTIQARATDAAGNTSAWKTQKVRIR